MIEESAKVAIMAVFDGSGPIKIQFGPGLVALLDFFFYLILRLSRLPVNPSAGFKEARACVTVECWSSMVMGCLCGHMCSSIRLLFVDTLRPLNIDLKSQLKKIDVHNDRHRSSVMLYASISDVDMCWDGRYCVLRMAIHEEHIKYLLAFGR